MASFIWLAILLEALWNNAYAVDWLELRITELNTANEDKRIAVAKGVVKRDLAIKVLCPKPYVIYPRNDNATAEDPLVFIEASGDFTEVPLSRVIHNLHGKPVLQQVQDEMWNGIQIHYQGVDDATIPLRAIRKHADHIYFLCALPGTNAHRNLSDKLRYLKLYEETPTSKSVKNDVNKYLKDTQNALGMLSIDISLIRKVTHGCGSKDTPYFLNAAEYDHTTGVRSCTVDIMEHPDVGFYCDGIVQPNYCLTQLFESGTSNLIMPGWYATYDNFPQQNLRIANFKRKMIKKVFNGYCQCLDAFTGTLKAEITLKTGKSHVCDISALIFKHLTQPIVGNWCDVALLPGSDLTIKVPINIYDEKGQPSTGGDSMPWRPNMMTSYIYPEDMERYCLDPEMILDEVHPPTIYEPKNYALGDALRIDQSKHEDEGIITMHYLEGIPMTYPDYLEGLAYTWNFTANKERFAIKDILATINVIPVATHPFKVYGCEPPTSKTFIMKKDDTNNTRELDINGHKVRMCNINPNPGNNVLLYCPHGQTMEPSGCLNVGYNASLQNILDWNDVAIVKEGEWILEMRSLHKLGKDMPTSYSRSCSCVDKNGVETAKLILSSYVTCTRIYTGLGPREIVTLIVPSINIMDIMVEGRNLKEVQEVDLPFPLSYETIVLTPGTRVQGECRPMYGFLNPVVISLRDTTRVYMIPLPRMTHIEDVTDENEDANSMNSEFLNNHELFLPLNKDKFFYASVIQDGKEKMMPVEYSEVLGTNAAGFRVSQTKLRTDKSDHGIIIVENPMNSIIVSKNNGMYVNLKYTCSMITRSNDSLHKEVMAGMGREMESRETQIVPCHSCSYDTLFKSNDIAYPADVMGRWSLYIWGVMDIVLPVTDPYLRGCGMTDPSEELFREDTVPIHNDAGDRVGCEVDIAEGNSSFYCPLPYHTQPPKCMPTSPTGAFRVKQPGESGSEHFYIFESIEASRRKEISLKGMKRESFECHCITNKGVIMSTIRVLA